MWSLQQTGVDFRYQGDYLPGSYTDGDIVVYGGVTYLCVRPTGSAPTPWTPPQQSPSYGTTLPANPVDGQEHVLVDSATNPSYQWRFRYNAGSTSAYKWEFVGGSSWRADNAAAAALAAGGWTTLAPTLTLPRAGDWVVSSSGMFVMGSTALIGIAVGVPGLISDSTNHATATQYQGLASSEMVIAGVAAGTVASIYYYAASTGHNLQSRHIRAVPVRVS